MLSKDPIKITSIVITFVIFLAGASLSFWIYNIVIGKQNSAPDENIQKIEVSTDKLANIEKSGSPNVTSPEDGYGRNNHFLSYK